MFRLLKYEMRKTMMPKLILLGITFVAQVIFLAGLWGNREETLAAGTALLFFIAVIGITLMGILSVVTLHRDMNTKQGYMLFMTPNSSYRILGAKVIECGLSLLIAGAFFFALGMLDFSLLLGRGANQQAWDILKQALRTINDRIQLDLPHVSALVFNLLASWLCVITTAYLSDVVSSALLKGKKWNGMVTFLLFLALNWATSKLVTLVPTAVGVIPEMLWQSAAELALAVVMYIITARLMEKYLSV